MHKTCNVIVNSCQDYYKTTVSPLIESLLTAGVPDDCIMVIVGDSNEDYEELKNNILYYYRRYCNIDNNAMCFLTQEKQISSDWIVYLHDTSLVAKDFWQQCACIINDEKIDNTNVSCIRLYSHFSMGMGFYRSSWHYSDIVNNYMQSIINYDKNKRLMIKQNLPLTEDTLFKFALNGNGKCMTLPNEYIVQEENKKMYNTDIPRIVEYYKIPGVYKIKANYKHPLFVAL